MGNIEISAAKADGGGVQPEDEQRDSGLVESSFKSIVLFSDGTGNSSAKLFKTNVWRMYEAVDLGPPEEGQRKQIAFYDNGVGTSALKPLAAIGSVFGIGLKRNVLDIYRYACRNYKPGDGQDVNQEPGNGGDHIYGFGFSRGSFTMRIAIALIASEGLVTSRNEAELEWKSEEAWRAYRGKFLPRRWHGLAKAARGVGRAWRSLRGAGRDYEAYDRDKNYKPVIRFLGVWDTVAAYGGPITEITRAIDNWIARLTMFDYALNPRVRCARHALSIDDERDAFRPLLWDELAEEKLIKDSNREATPWLRTGRLEQVWFTGMHADVGGGYPDESLSFVSFLWMMEEAKKADLRPVPAIVDHFRALASSAGPIHDSRSGLGSYYRYQPRKIGAWLDPIDPTTFSQRDPDLKRGLIKVVKVHESVAARIASGTDRYAPITLPAEIKIVPPQAEGENASPTVPAEASAPATVGPAVSLAEKAPLPLISDELRARLEDPDSCAERVEAMASVWRLVDHRRRAYFATLTLTLLLVFMPSWIDWLLGASPAPLIFPSGHGLVASIIALLSGILPAFLSGLIATWAANPFYFLLLLSGILFTRSWSAARERKLRDEARTIWDRAVDLEHRPSPRRQAQNRPPSRLQRFLRWAKWSLLPGLIGLLMLALAAWLILILAARMTLAVRERTASYCEYPAAAAPELTSVDLPFNTASTCSHAGRTVEIGKTYIVDFDVTEKWADGTEQATPAGLSASDIGFAGYFGAPLRRAAGAGYLQPMAHIRASGDWSGPSIVPLQLTQQGSPRTRWRGVFVAPRSGELSLFANEASPPFPLPLVSKTGNGWGIRLYGPKGFYREAPFRNEGAAKVTIVRADHVIGRRPVSQGAQSAATAGFRPSP